MSTDTYKCYGCSGSPGPCGIDASTKDLLGQVSVGCRMAVQSMNQIMEHVEDAELLKLINRYKMQHEELEGDANDLLRKAGEVPPDPSLAGTAFSWISTEMKLTWNNETGEAAKLLMDGCNMGIQSISEYLNKNSSASSTSKELAARLISVEEELSRKLKKYL